MAFVGSRVSLLVARAAYHDTEPAFRWESAYTFAVVVLPAPLAASVAALRLRFRQDIQQAVGAALLAGGSSAPQLPASEVARLRNAQAVWFALYPEAWVQRRRETYEFVDDSTVRRRISIDYSIDREAMPFPVPSGEPLLLPVAMLDKRPLVALDITSADGACLTILNTSANTDVIVEGTIEVLKSFVAQAKAKAETRFAQFPTAANRAACNRMRSLLARVQMSATLAADLRGVVASPAADGDVAARTFLSNSLVVEALAAAGPFPGAGDLRAFIERLGSSFVGLVPRAVVSNEPHLIKLGYDAQNRWWTGAQRRGWPRGVANGVGACLGLVAKRVVLSDLQADAQSFHAEIIAPEDCRMHGTRIQTTTTDPLTGATSIRRSPTSSRERRASHHAPTVFATDTSTLNTGIWARRDGAYGAIVLTAVATAAILVTISSRTSELDNQTSAAIVLLTPAIVVAWLTRAGEHAFVTRLMFGVRMLGLALALLSLTFAMILGGGYLKGPPAHPSAVPEHAQSATNKIAFSAAVIAVILLAGLVAPWLGNRGRRLAFCTAVVCTYGLAVA